MTEKTRYSDEELEEFKGLINKKLKEAQEDLDLLMSSISHEDNGTDDTSPTFKNDGRWIGYLKQRGNFSVGFASGEIHQTSPGCTH